MLGDKSLACIPVTRPLGSGVSVFESEDSYRVYRGTTGSAKWEARPNQRRGATKSAHPEKEAPRPNQRRGATKSAHGGLVSLDSRSWGLELPWPLYVGYDC